MMKRRLHQSLILLAAVGFLVACSEEPAATPVSERTPKQLPVVELEPLAPLPEDKDEAAAILLREMMEAYRNAPAIEDRVSIRFLNDNLMQRQPQVLTVHMGEGSDVFLRMAWNEWTAVDGYVYLTDTRVEDRYVVTPLIGDLQRTLKTTFGTAGGLPAHFGLRYESKRGQLLQRLGMGVIRSKPQISACRREADEDGNLVDKLTLTSAEGYLTLHVDPRARFITYAYGEKDLGGGGVGPQVMIEIEITFDPRVRAVDELPITFDPDDRQPVSTIEALHDA